MKILVVEDSTNLLTSLVADLRKFGYVVDAVADATEAIVCASAGDYLVHPFSIDDLHSRIQSLVQRLDLAHVPRATE